MSEAAENRVPVCERRATIRYAIAAEVDLTTSQGLVSAHATEISVYGVRLRSSKAIYPGTKLRLFFKRLPDFSICGHVVWALNTINDLGLNFYEAGVFIDKLIWRRAVANGLAARSEIMPELLLALREQMAEPEE